MTLVTVGIDISLTGCGFVELTGDEVTNHFTVHTTTKHCLEERIHLVQMPVLRAVRRSGASWIVVEGGSRGGKFVDLNVYQLAGVIRHKLWLRRRLLAPVRIVTPTELKLEATGNGRADKKLMTAKAREFWPECPNNNEADAYHLAAWGRDNYDLFFS